MKNAIVGVYNTIYVVTVIVYIECENAKVYSPLYNVVVTYFCNSFIFINSVLPCASMSYSESRERSCGVAETPATDW